MKNKLKLLMKIKQSIIAVIILLVMVFNACSGGGYTPFTPEGNTPTGSNPGGSSVKTLEQPVLFYVDKDGNYSDKDSGRTALVADAEAYAVFYSDDYESGADRVGFAFEDKTIIFFFDKGNNFPSSMVMSDTEDSFLGVFTPYINETQTYGLIIDQNEEGEETWTVPMDDTFKKYTNNTELNESQNTRMHNMFVAMCIYQSLDDFIAANARSIFSWLGKAIKTVGKFFSKPVVKIVTAVVRTGVGLAVATVGYATFNPVLMTVGIEQAIKGTANLYDAVENIQSGNPGGSGGGSYGGSYGGLYQPVPNKIVYYWLNEHGNLATTASGNTVTIAPNATLTITAQSAGYVIKQWHLDGVNTGQSGSIYNFSSTVIGKHTVGLFVEKDGKLYNTNVTVWIQN